MRIYFRLLAVILVLLLAGAMAGAQTLPEETRRKVDGVFAEYSKPGSPGCAVGVVREGALIHARGYGLASIEHAIPLSPRSVLDIGSTSKQFSAASILLLAQQGKLSIDDEVRKHIPELPDYGRPLTIRHLLNHTSGLRDYLTLFSLAGVDFEGVTTAQDALNIIVRQKELNFSPGSEYLYSNSGFFLLSEIVQRASGKSLRRFAAENLFAPLGMSRTFYLDDHTEIIPGRATGYAPRRGGGFRVAMSGFEQTGDGAVQTTVEDLAKWDANFYEPRVGGRAMWEALLMRGVLSSGEKIDYALGLRVAEFRGLPTISHGGSWAGYRAEFLRFAEQRLAVICLCNLTSANPTALAERVAEVFLEDRMKPREAASTAMKFEFLSLPEEKLRAFAGIYRNPVSGALRRVAVSGGALTINSLGPQTTELGAVSPAKFRPLRQPPAAELEFLPASAGQAARLIVRREFRQQEEFVAVPPPAENWKPEDFAGDYASDEIDATHRLRAEGGKLTLRIGAARAQELEPIFRDAFRAGEIQCLFQRDAKGNISGYTVQAGRVRNIRFTRR